MLTQESFAAAFGRSVPRNGAGSVSLKTLVAELESAGEIDRATAALLSGSRDVFLRSERDARRLFDSIVAPRVDATRARVPQRAELTEMHALARSPLTDARRSKTVARWLELPAHHAGFMPPSEGNDVFLEDLCDEIGFGRTPHVVTREELERFIANGEKELLRGVKSSDYAEEFRSGPLYGGTGSSGNGIYTLLAVRRDYAEHKAENGAVLRMTLKRGARVVRDDQLESEMYRDLQAMKREAEKEISLLRARAEARGGPAAEKLGEKIARARRDADRLELLLYTDPGRYAASRGFDAIEVSGTATYLVLNRTALRVQDTDL